MNGKNILLWILQIIPAGILFLTSYGKLSSQPGEVQLFTALGMEPTGRYIIGVVEGLAALLFLTGRFAATGGLLAVGTMLGALIAHATIIGFDPKHAILLSTVLTCSLIVTVARRRELPLIGRTLSD
jgi:putative oxidoreductase